MDCADSKKLIVPTVHPVGVNSKRPPDSAFSLLYKDAFCPIDVVPQRSLPKTNYVHTELGFVHPSFFPPSLDISAYLNWIKKLCRPTGVKYDSRETLRSIEILEREFRPFVTGGLSSWEEVLADIDWKKSPGWPYVNQGCATKRDAWEKFEPEIRERVEKLIRGEYVECLFIASLKDELLPEGKNARVFCPAPFHHQLACAILFKKMSDQLTSSVHKHSSAIGVDLPNRGLERMLRRLSKHPDAYDADQSGCDTSCRQPEPEREFSRGGLPREYWPGVDLLWNQACCPKIIVVDRVIQVTFNPSGWFLTTVLNTLRTHRMVASAFMDVSPVPVAIDEMREQLEQLNGGDDLAYSTNQPWFGIVPLADELARHGVYLESDVLSPRHAFDLTFFSHRLKLRYVDALGCYTYVAQGRLGKLLSSFSYLKKKEGEVNWLQQAQRACGLAVNLWSFKDVYDQLAPYLSHLVHHFFYLDGQDLSSEWSGVFRSLPNDYRMMLMLNGHAKPEGFLFFTSRSSLGSSPRVVKRALQSALKSDLFDKQKMTKTQTQKNASKLLARAKTVKPNEKLLRKVAELELKNAKTEARLAAASTHAEKTIEASHAPTLSTKREEKKKGIFDTIASAGKKLLDKGLETLVTLGPALLLAEHVQVQLKAHNEKRRAKGLEALDDGVIPAGTILYEVPICPSFAEFIPADAGGGDLKTTRLQQKADIFLRYQFKPGTRVCFEPAAGALNNGQIGFFIPSDPRTEITATGLDAVRLVKEYNGASTNISQPASLPVPPKVDWLFVDDTQESDVRFTQQGKLWIIAFTDLVLASAPNAGAGTTSALGEFYLDYKIELRDDAVAGSTISPQRRQDALVVECQTSVPTTYGSMYFPLFGGPTSALPVNIMVDVNDENFFSAPLADGYTWTVNQGGIFWIEYEAQASTGALSITPTCLAFDFITTPGGIDSIQYTNQHGYTLTSGVVPTISAKGTVNGSFAIELQSGDTFYMRMYFSSSIGGPNVETISIQYANLSVTQLVEYTDSAYINLKRGKKNASIRKSAPVLTKWKPSPSSSGQVVRPPTPHPKENRNPEESEWVNVTIDGKPTQVLRGALK